MLVVGGDGGDCGSGIIMLVVESIAVHFTLGMARLSDPRTKQCQMVEIKWPI